MAVKAVGLAYARESRARVPAPEPKVVPLVAGQRNCGDCPYRHTCKVLVKFGLPVLCERLEEGEAEVLEKAISWP